jgi:hypothetical protein
MQLPGATNYNPSSINYGVPSIFGQQGGGGGGLGGFLQGNLGNILGGGLGLLNMIQGQRGMSQNAPYLDVGNWNNMMQENISQNPFAGRMNQTWDQMGGLSNTMQQMGQQGPQFGTGGAQAVGPAQGMLAQNFRQLSNFDPKEMRQERGEARERRATPQGYTRGGAVGAAAQESAQAEQQRQKMMNPAAQSGAAASRANTLSQGQRDMGALQQGIQQEERDIGLSADLAKNINQQQLQGKLGATGAASAHGQLGLGGFNADTQRGLGSFNAQGNMLGQAGNLLSNMGQQQGTAFGQTYIDPKDQAKFAQDQYNAYVQQRNAGGGGLLSMIPGLNKIPGLRQVGQLAANTFGAPFGGNIWGQFL